MKTSDFVKLSKAEKKKVHWREIPTLNKVAAIAMVGVCVTILGMCMVGGDTAKSTKELAAYRQDAINAIKLEPKVLDAVITEANVLYAVTQDDGTRRDGYAEYLCQVMNQYKAQVNKVVVVKPNTEKDPNRDNAYGVHLGEAVCN